MDANRLAEIAAQLATRVREDDPSANARWLNAVTSDEDRWALLFVLAAAIPVDVPWSVLTGWATSRDRIALDRRPHGTMAAVRRHNYRHEPMCEACRIVERDRTRERRAVVHNLGKKAVDKTGKTSTRVDDDGPQGTVAA